MSTVHMKTSFVKISYVLNFCAVVRIHFLGLPDPDPLVRGTDPDTDTDTDPDPDPDHPMVNQK
jgi:hypothetical protein